MKNESLILDAKAQTIANNFRRTEGELLDVLQLVEDKKAYLDFFITSLFRYCVDRLRLSESYAYAFISIVRKSKQVPELKKAVTDGVLSVSQAKRIVSVIDPVNAPQWIETASSKKQKDLEAAVAAALPEPLPSGRAKHIGGQMSQLKLVVPADVRKKLERLMEVRGLSMVEALGFALTETLTRHDPVEKAKRNVKPAPAQPSLRNAQRVAIPAAVVHAVNRRDEGQCVFRDAQGVRCTSRQWTHLHHTVPVHRGGQHAVSNLATLCSAHHRILHSLGQAPKSLAAPTGPVYNATRL